MSHCSHNNNQYKAKSVTITSRLAAKERSVYFKAFNKYNCYLRGLQALTKECHKKKKNLKMNWLEALTDDSTGGIL